MIRNNWHWFLFVFLIGAFSGAIIFNSCSKPETREVIKYERDSLLQLKVDSLKDEIVKKDIKLDSISERIDTLNIKLAEINAIRKQNKKHLEKELEEIENTNADSLTAYIRRQLKNK